MYSYGCSYSGSPYLIPVSYTHLEPGEAPAPQKKGFFARLKEGLTKTRNSISDSFNNLFKASELDDDFYDELEETLVMSDMGYELSLIHIFRLS